MQFLSVSHRRTTRFDDADFAAYVEEEVAHARVLYREGFIRQIWHRSDVPGACMVIEANSEEEARQKLNALPMVRAGMLEVVIIPLKPYAGFGQEDQVPFQNMKEDQVRRQRTEGDPVHSKGSVPIERS